MRRIAQLFAALPLVFGCSSAEPAAPLVVATFNAGLTELFVEHTAERAPHVADALASFDADVVCLQEVWSAQHVEAVLAATEARFPHAVVLAPDQETVAGACDADALEPLATCVANACADPPEAGCILQACTPEYEAQPGDCRVCLASSLGGTLDEITTTCSEQAPRFQYGGSYGLMLLSRTPVVAHDHLELEASLNRRAVIHAELEGGVHVLCTHLTAVESVPYPVDGGSWEEEQRGQIAALLEHLAAMPAAPAVTALLGDLNVGPAGGSHEAKQPEQFARLLAAGLERAFTGSCTYCDDNPLVAGGSPSVLIDHVLVRGATTTAAARTLDGTLTVGGLTTALSDHYAVRTTLTR